MRRLAMFAPFAAAALLAGCGSSSSSSTTTTSSPASASGSGTPAAASGSGGVSLSEAEFKITPASPKVPKTGKITITVTNNGAITHALAVQTPSGLVKTPHIAPGHSAKLTVTISKAGTYTFYCPISTHRQAGMHGTLVVGSGAAASGGASSSQTTSTSSSSGGGGYAY
jgi:plastocyanin